MKTQSFRLWLSGVERPKRNPQFKALLVASVILSLLQISCYLINSCFVHGAFTLAASLALGLCARSTNEAIIYVCVLSTGALITDLFAIAFGIYDTVVLRCLMIFPVALAGSLYGFVIAWGYHINHEPMAPNSSLRCEKCDYWLLGLGERRCPECGTPFGRPDGDGGLPLE